MKKFSVLALLTMGMVFTSCDPWEDENNFNEPSGPVGPDQIMLLKEVKRVSEMSEGKQTYTYDSSGRLIKSIGYTNIADITSYSEANYTYTQNGVNLVVKTYMNNVPMQTMTTSMVVNGNQATLELISQMGGMDMSMSSIINFSAPCGENSIVTTSSIPDLPPMETTSTYDYFDNNCSYKLTEDGVLSETVYNDDKFSPYADVNSIAFNIIRHNPVKIINHVEDITENISYEYNSNGYPTKATHTFSNNEIDYIEYFTYY